MTLREIMLARFSMQAGTIIGFGSYAPTYKKPDPETGQSPYVTPFWMLGGAGVEIAVDCETGRIEIMRLVTVGDVGHEAARGQLVENMHGAKITRSGGAKW